MTESARYSLGSRPSSRSGWSHVSETTERPPSAGSTRTLTQEIDHIKHLVTRSQTASNSPPASAVVTAQLFRQQQDGNASTPASTAQIKQELDQLKKRLRSSAPLLLRKWSQADPETESESDDNTLDEREEALERAREELLLVKQNEELLLEAAERRVDGLADEKESLERTVEGHREELAKVQAEKTSLEEQLTIARQTSMEKERSHKTASEQIANLQALVLEMEALLTASSNRVTRLTAENKESAEKTRKMMEEHKAGQEHWQTQLAESKSKAQEHETRSNQLQQTLDSKVTEVERQAEEHHNQLEQVKSQHRDELHRIRTELEALNDEHVSQLSAHSAELSTVREAHDVQLRSVNDELDQARRAAEHTANTHAEQLAAVRAERGRDVQAAGNDVDDLKKEHMGAIERLKSEHADGMEGLKREHDLELARLKWEQDSLNEQLHATIADLGRTRDEHAKAQEAMKERHQTAIRDLEQNHEKSQLEERDVMSNTHEEELRHLRASLETQETLLAEAQANHQIALSDIETDWITRLDDAKTEHESALVAKDEDAARQLQDLENQHADALALAHQKAQDEAALAEQQHRSSLEAAVDRARQSGQAEVKNMKKRHQDAIAQIRVMAKNQAAIQIADLEDSHGKMLATSLEEAQMVSERSIQESNESHQENLLRLETEHQAALAGLEGRLRSEKEAEMSSHQDNFTAEIAALQSRLDASLTGQAEAERAVAVLRQQVSQGEKRIAEARASSTAENEALTQEKDDLTSQLEKVQRTLRELQSKVSNGATTHKRQSTYAELAATRLQLESFESERAASLSALQKKHDENNELTRQNDFLIKELETLLAQRSRSKLPVRNTADALVQTDDFISEPKVDLASIQHVKSERRKSIRPVTPLSPEQRQARDEVDMAWKSRSFDTAIKGLADTTAQKTMLASKIQEHLGQLQRAEEQLAVDYQSQLEHLARDKARLEKVITSQHAAAFAQERRHLVAQYDLDLSDDPSEYAAMLTSLPVAKARALRSAEQRLVHDYTRRIAQRKSHIALKHAHDFHTLAHEYDQKMSALLINREDYSSIEPELPSRSAHMAAVLSETPSSRHHYDDDAPRLIRRTSQPRTSHSLPRSVRRFSIENEPIPPVPMTVPNRDRPDATAQPFRGRERHAHAPVAQRSLMRAKTPTDVLPRPETRITSEPMPEPARPISSKRKKVEIATINGTTPLTNGSANATKPNRKPEPSPSPSIKPGFFRRVKDRFSLESRPLQFSRPVTSSRPGSRASNHFVDSTPTPPVPSIAKWEEQQQQKQQKQHEQQQQQQQAPQPAVPAGPTALSSASPHQRSRSKKNLSSGLIYYSRPEQASA